MIHEFRVNWTITILCILMYAGIMGYLVYYAEDIGKHPCQICSRETGENVMCYTLQGDSLKFYNNGTIETRFQSRNSNLPYNFTIVK